MQCNGITLKLQEQQINSKGVTNNVQTSIHAIIVPSLLHMAIIIIIIVVVVVVVVVVGLPLVPLNTFRITKGGSQRCL